MAFARFSGVPQWAQIINGLVVTTVELISVFDSESVSHLDLDLTCLGTSEGLARLRSLAQIGPGDSCCRSLGPAAICQYCNTAWLPGTLVCPNCSGVIDYQPQAIEYEGHKGYITSLKHAHHNTADFGLVEISLWLARDGIKWTGPSSFSLSIDNRPGSWLCGYCGLYVSGYSSKCPGCSGNRLSIKKLHDLNRQCIYCGQHVYSAGYACPTCNQRLMPIWNRTNKRDYA